MIGFKDYIFKFLEDKRQPKIILIGGPGSGKSTYAKFLTKEFNIAHIYPGDLLRKEKESGSEMGKRLTNLGKGDFAPNDIVKKLVFDAVAKADGFVFDGFPRYMQQVKDMNEKGIIINKIVYLNVSEEEVIRRLTARGRADDKPEIIKNRLKVYERETAPLLTYYKDEIINIKAEGSTPERISKEIIGKIT